MLAEEVKLALQPTLNNVQHPPPFLRSSSPKKRREQEGRKANERVTRRSVIRDLGNRGEKNRLIAVQRNRRVTMKGFIITAAVCRAIALTIALRAREMEKRVRRQGLHAVRNREDPTRSHRRGIYYSNRAARRASSDSAVNRA